MTEQRLLHALRWQPGRRLGIQVYNGLLVVGSADDGRHRVGSRGALPLPASARRMCWIEPGQPVLLAALAPSDLLVIQSQHEDGIEVAEERERLALFVVMAEQAAVGVRTVISSVSRGWQNPLTARREEINMGWLAADADYEVSLDRGKVIARNRQGRQLKGLPKALRDADVVVGLRQLSDWLKRHDISCRREVEQWMVRSLPVPTTVICEVWADEAWRTPLRDLVVVPIDDAGRWDTDRAGLLRDADPEKGLGVVDLDGESGRLTAAQVVLPHPVRLADLADLREFAADLGVRQETLQLFREVWARPESDDERRRELSRYAGGRYKELRHVQARATSAGYRVQGGAASVRVWEDGVPTVAAVWIGEGDPLYETETGPLYFTDPSGEALALAAVGPVAWSEGMRMAAVLYAGRVVDEDGEQA